MRGCELGSCRPAAVPAAALPGGDAPARSDFAARADRGSDRVPADHRRRVRRQRAHSSALRR